jgi:hypothetical protein
MRRLLDCSTAVSSTGSSRACRHFSGYYPSRLRAGCTTRRVLRGVGPKTSKKGEDTVRRRVIAALSAALMASGFAVVILATPAYAGVPATGVITCNMVTSTASAGTVTHGLSSTGTATHVKVKFTATFKCAPPQAVTYPSGVLVTGGTLKGALEYVAASSAQPANTCTDFNGVDLLSLGGITIKWTQTPSTPHISPTAIKYVNLGAGTVSGGVITLTGVPPHAIKGPGSFGTPNLPNTVQLVTNLPPVSSCPVVTPPSTPFVIAGGTISV